MKSTEVYASLREELSPLLKSLGFKREKALLSWSRQHDGQYTVLWCQVSQDGWDDYAGSKFAVEFQRSERPETRARLGKLLTDDQRAEATRLQSRVIADLSRPHRTHPPLNISPEVTRWYLEKFEPLRGQYGPTDDLWLRYAKAQHVHMWAGFLQRSVPSCIEAIESARSEQGLAVTTDVVGGGASDLIDAMRDVQ